MVYTAPKELLAGAQGFFKLTQNGDGDDHGDDDSNSDGGGDVGGDDIDCDIYGDDYCYGDGVHIA
jgi:hypothetical protein